MAQGGSRSSLLLYHLLATHLLPVSSAPLLLRRPARPASPCKFDTTGKVLTRVGAARARVQTRVKKKGGVRDLALARGAWSARGGRAPRVRLTCTILLLPLLLLLLRCACAQQAHTPAFVCRILLPAFCPGRSGRAAPLGSAALRRRRGTAAPEAPPTPSHAAMSRRSHRVRALTARGHFFWLDMRFFWR